MIELYTSAKQRKWGVKGLVSAIGLVLLFACVPNKKLVYLQEGAELKERKSIETDTVLRTHTMEIREYRIQPLDILSVNFESLTSEEYDFFSKVAPFQQGGAGAGQAFLAFNGILVDANGDLEYPVVGKIQVAGLTVFEAQEKVQRIASQYMRDVIVRIRLLNFRYTVLGEVRAEQTVTSFNTRLTLMEAIGLVGGLSDMADRSRVKVIRQKGAVSEVFYVNLLDEDLMNSPLYYVQQNDIIIVPPLHQRPFRTYFAQNLALFTSSISAVLVIITLLSR
ncbi:polysaccharide biosynthesis/export family protein [Cytophagales bacterium LB-30]|uniref:Polysaccharide biosynthesis/export family protein n=1 Tax=Shiella aurantiaca TaxID=3058365 RepID=A0ABT8F831_9BACT|nr:polysaccharide biosynthesis/export family protein [Shiella aurantiaca]MDN4166605.1 polysaccharide biosynthesis/export family protein [Shiella aurantiaca]